MKRTIRVGILDLNDGLENQGIRSIKEVLRRYSNHHRIEIVYDVFDVRQKEEVPSLNYDVYISSGGPGSPYDGEGKSWENTYFSFIDEVENYNDICEEHEKKSIFFICHSFQMMCRKYQIGNVCRRKSTSFGIFPLTLTEEGKQDLVFAGLPAPFYVVDSRDWQLIEPNTNVLERMGGQILAYEKERPYIRLPQCVMAIRFSKYFFGTQFHPEADVDGMRVHFSKPEKKETIIKHHGLKKLEDMFNHLADPDKIMLTQKQILPNFLTKALSKKLTYHEYDPILSPVV